MMDSFDLSSIKLQLEDHVLEQKMSSFKELESNLTQALQESRCSALEMLNEVYIVCFILLIVFYFYYFFVACKFKESC